MERELGSWNGACQFAKQEHFLGSKVTNRKMKRGFTLLNDGETALVVPLTPSRQSAFEKDYWRAHIVRHEGMTQEAFIETYRVMDGAEEFIAVLRCKHKITDEQLKEAIQKARQNGTPRSLRRLVAYCKSQRRATSQSY